MRKVRRREIIILEKIVDVLYKIGNANQIVQYDL